MLVLRTCNADMTSYENFVWPTAGPVEAPDWQDNYRCGHGLHGLPWGEGRGDLLDWNPGAKWLVVDVPDDSIRHGQGDMVGICKFPKGKVVHCGDQKSATDYVAQHGGQGKAIVGIVLTGGDWATLTGGDWATLTGGYGATLTGGYGATLIGGDWATLTGGNWATLTGGYRATLTGGDWATLTGGDWATLTGGDWATLTGGDWATLTGGDWATLTGGDWATLTGGNWATLIIKHWDTKACRSRLAMAYVGENGINPNVAYKLNEKHEFVEA